jgi:hypothetical protein
MKLFAPPARDVVSGRAARLTRAGIDRPTAEILAADLEVDLHVLLELLERGCPPTLAARIVAPL